MHSKTLTFLLALLLLTAFGANAELVPDDIQPAPGVVSLFGETPGSSEGAWPQGVQQINLHFPTKNLKVNPDCQGYIHCFHNGAPSPVASLKATEASVDTFIPGDAQFMFAEKLTNPGTYHISVPAGVWMADGSLSESLELDYEILRFWQSTPPEGAVHSLSVITLSFPETEGISGHDGEIRLFSDQCEIPIDITYDYSHCRIFIEPQTALSSGDYTLEADPGAILLEYPGGQIILSNKIRLFWQLTTLAAPIISPAEGLLSHVESFELTLPSDQKLLQVNDRIISRLHRLNADGSHQAAEEALFLPSQTDVSKIRLTNTLSDPAADSQLLVPAGDYVLILGSDTYIAEYQGDKISSPEFSYRFASKGDPRRIETFPYQNAMLQEIESVEVTFPDALQVSLNSGADPVTLTLTPDDGAPKTIWQPEVRITGDNSARVTFPAKMTTAGLYTLSLPRRLFLCDGVWALPYTLNFQILSSGLIQTRTDTDTTDPCFDLLGRPLKTGPSTTLQRQIIVTNGEKIILR